MTPGRGDFYIIKIDAVADPTPPEITAEDLAEDHAARMRELLAQMEHMTEDELLQQVFRRVTLALCAACYRQWIENPVP